MAHPFLSYLAPIRPEKPFAGAFILDAVRGTSRVELDFRDIKNRKNFCLVLFPAKLSENAFAQAGRLGLAMNLEGRSTPEIERLAQAVAKIVEKNTQVLSDLELEALFDRVDENDASVVGGKRLDLIVGFCCVSACLFCADRSRDSSYPKLTLVEMTQTLEKARREGYDALTLTGQEPTLHPDLPKLVAVAHEMGFNSILLKTNGVKIAEKAYLQNLLDRGLTGIGLSIHAADGKTEASLTKTPDLFEKKFVALGNMRELFGDRDRQERTGKHMFTTTILAKQNLATLPETIRMLDRFEVFRIALDYPWIVGGAKEHLLNIVPDYESVAHALLPFKSRFSDNADALHVGNLPACILQGLRSHTNQRKDVYLACSVWQGKEKESQSEMILVETPMNREMSFADSCTACLLKKSCPGVSKTYLKHYGALGLQPVLAE